eukprot:scaffold37889_cov30-Tisochrysis_lutea.AAC.2
MSLATTKVRDTDKIPINSHRSYGHNYNYYITYSDSILLLKLGKLVSRSSILLLCAMMAAGSRPAPTRRQYDQRRLRVRPTAEEPSWGGSTRQVLAERARVEQEESRIISLQCEELNWRLEAEHREARLHELTCAKRLQCTLHLAERALQADVDAQAPADATSDLTLVRKLHQRALRDVRRLAELEDEWSIMRGDEALVRAVNERHRADIAKRRCADIRELLLGVPLQERCCPPWSLGCHAPPLLRSQLGTWLTCRCAPDLADRLAEEELIATAEDGFEFVSRHVSELSTALMVTQDLMMGLAELEHERERQLDQMYEASDRKLLAEAERLRREIGEGELRRTELQAMAGPTTRQTETVQLLEEESRQLEATLTELHATRAKLTTQLEESVSRRDEAQARQRELEGRYGEVAHTLNAARAAQARAQADLARVEKVPRGMKPEDYARLQMLRAKHGVHVAANLARRHKVTPSAPKDLAVAPAFSG